MTVYINGNWIEKRNKKSFFGHSLLEKKLNKQINKSEGGNKSVV